MSVLAELGRVQISAFYLFRHLFSLIIYLFIMGLDSSVGIATGYGLHGLGIESR